MIEKDNYKLISRILKNNNINTRELKHERGKRKYNDIDFKYNNMATHLIFDFDKLKCLNDMISKMNGIY